jgi:16S rRNA processing protein RimM
VSAAPRLDDLILVGQCLRPQGRRGEILTRPLSDNPERFQSLKRVFVETREGGCREVSVENAWPHKDRWVLKLEGVESIDAAEQLRGLRLGLLESALPPLDKGTYYHHQLRGLRVEDEQGRGLGVVEDLLETGAALVLVVRGADGERLVPFAESFVRQVDLAAGRLVVELLETVDAAG